MPAAGPSAPRRAAAAARWWSREHHDLLQARRREMQTPAFQEQMHRRNAIEGTISEFARNGGRRTRYRGLAKTALANYFHGAAINAKRWIRLLQYRMGPDCRRGPVRIRRKEIYTCMKRMRNWPPRTKPRDNDLPALSPGRRPGDSSAFPHPSRRSYTPSPETRVFQPNRIRNYSVESSRGQICHAAPEPPRFLAFHQWHDTRTGRRHRTRTVAPPVKAISPTNMLLAPSGKSPPHDRLGRARPRSTRSCLSRTGFFIPPGQSQSPDDGHRASGNRVAASRPEGLGDGLGHGKSAIAKLRGLRLTLPPHPVLRLCVCPVYPPTMP